MALKVYKEAHIGTTKFTVAPDWFSIEGEDEISGAKACFTIKRDEARELVNWLRCEFQEEQMIKPPVWLKDVDIKEPGKPVKKEEPCTYDPGPRSATQTVPLKLGDPNLAYQGFAGRAPGDGQTGVVDLGAMHGKAVIS